MRQAARLAAFLACAWLLAGCSALRIAYDNADTFLRWRATDYLDLRGEALDDLNERIDAFHAWHRAEALPKYARFAGEAASRVEAGFTPADIVWGYDAFIAQAGESLREAAERIAPVLDRLTDGQIAFLEARFAADNRKFVRENMRGSEKERRSLRFRRSREQLEDWVGPLSEPQLARLRQYAERTPLFDELRLRERKRLQAELVSMLRAREARKRLPEAALNWRQHSDPAYTAASDAFRVQYFRMLGELEGTLSPMQRAHLVGRLRGYAEDFAALAVAREARQSRN